MSNILMSRTIHGVLAALAGAVVMLSVPASAAPAGELSSKQTASLASLGVRVVVPASCRRATRSKRWDHAVLGPRSTEHQRDLRSGARLTSCAITRARRVLLRGHRGGIGGTSLTYTDVRQDAALRTVALRFGSGPDVRAFAQPAAQLHAVQNEVYCDWLGSGRTTTSSVNGSRPTSCPRCSPPWSGCPGQIAGRITSLRDLAIAAAQRSAGTKGRCKACCVTFACTLSGVSAATIALEKRATPRRAPSLGFPPSAASARRRCRSVGAGTLSTTTPIRCCCSKRRRCATSDVNQAAVDAYGYTREHSSPWAPTTSARPDTWRAWRMR